MSKPGDPYWVAAQEALKRLVEETGRAVMSMNAQVATATQAVGAVSRFARGGPVAGRGYDGFDGKGELAVGSVFGVRAWKVPNWYEALATADLPKEKPGARSGWYPVGPDLGTLRSRVTPDKGLTGHFNGLWLPGENIARCAAGEGRGGVVTGGGGGNSVSFVGASGAGGGGGGGGGPSQLCGFFTAASGPCNRPAPCPLHGPGHVGVVSGGSGSYSSTSNVHQVPNENCGCGFWAYWSAEDGHVKNVRDAIHITGVVEGYGLTLIGTKGFRAEKARIVALCFATAPNVDQVFEQKAAVLEDTAGRLYGVPTFATQGIMLDRFPLTADYLPKRECSLCGARKNLIEDALFSRGQGYMSTAVTVCQGCASKLLGGRPW